MQRITNSMSKADRDWIGTLECCLCGNPSDVVGHHLTVIDREVAVNPETFIRGMGLKASDDWMVPLCTPHHSALHAVGERCFWRRAHSNPTSLAERLAEARPDAEVALALIKQFRSPATHPR